MKRIIIALLMMGIVGGSYPFMLRFSQSFKFVDEDEHMVIGWLMAHGSHLYTDISTNHQPLNYVVSSAVHHISHPPNVFMLVQRHRQVVFLWSVIWVGLLTWRLGWTVGIPLLVFEAAKYWLLGNEFIAESFAVYPTLYVFGSSWQFWWRNIRVQEEFFLGICIALASFFLIPLAIPLGLLLGLRLLYVRQWKSGLLLFVGFACVCSGLFTIVPFGDYVREAIYFNGKYGVPLLSQFRSFSDVIRLWGLPFLAMIQPNDPLTLLYASLGLLWFVYGIFLITKRQWRKCVYLLISYGMWNFTNVRDIELHRYHYAGFHLLPWLAVGLLLTALLFVEFTSFFGKWRWRIFILGLIGWNGWFWFQPQLPWRNVPNPQTENYVQYTPQIQVAELINTLQSDSDTLMTIPNETLPYWITGLHPATRQVTYYEWQYRNPLLRTQWQKIIESSPPRFITYLNEGASFTPWIQQVLLTKYVKLFDYPLVYIRKDSIGQITPEQRQQFLNLTHTHTGINISVFETK